MKTRNIILLLCAAILLSSNAVAKTNENQISVVPIPQSVVAGTGYFNIAGAPFNCDAALGEMAQKAVRDFSVRMGLATGKQSVFATPIGLAKSVAGGKFKGVAFVYDAGIESENYVLDVTSDNIAVKASDYAGVFYAIQTLKQLLPAEIYGSQKNVFDKKCNVPCCSIVDGPRFHYRGVHLDPCRHFWSVEEVKRYIDVMSVYKFNRLHWHLTEDQGWRVEIKALPLLTEVGAWRNGTMIGHRWDIDDGIRYGGFYTQEEVKDIIAYAQERAIEIIPEVDLPGHMLAALAAYPELACFGDHFEVRQYWGVSSSVLCPGKESTFEFLETVLGELADLFPSEYFHIGGDECPKAKWELCDNCQARIKDLGLEDDPHGSAEQKLQNYVTYRIQQFLATKGKKIIGWDEILEGGNLQPGATVMSWRGSDGGIQAAKKGFDCIMTPNTYLYFDYCQDENQDKEPISIGGFSDLKHVYSYEPFEGMEPGTESHILGAQCNMWTEYIATPEHLEYMLLPRMLALGEVVWSNPASKDYKRFLDDVQKHEYKVLDQLGLNYKKY